MQAPAPHLSKAIGGNVDKKDFKFRIKNLTDAGTFEGLAAVYNNVDLGGDRILPGAFTRTLSAGKKVPVLWQHDPSNPIGTCTITDSREGLLVTGTLELSDPTAKKAYTFMKSGVVKGLSIGYDTIQSSFDGDVRNLTELRLWEVSAVTFPMNESAQVTAVKAITDDDRAKHLKAIDTHRKAIDRHQRGIREHLKAMFDCIDDDDTGDADDLALIDDEGDLEETKAFAAELRKMASTINGGDSGNSPAGPLYRGRILGCR
jgi:HK97 family phage prohead protease